MNSVRKIFKSMGLFGGVQVITILCSIIRTKLVAIWIGPMGVGLFGIFNQALETLNTGTNLGMRQSSVRDISQAVENGDGNRISRIITAVRRWSVWLALGGALVTMALAPVLSRYTFGDTSHIWGYVALSAAVFLMAITNGEYAILQGTAKLRKLAMVTICGTFCGLIVSIPLFYWLRERSILPSIIAYALACALFAVLFRNHDYAPVPQTKAETVAIGKDFISLGIFMTAGAFAGMLANYIFVAWLNYVAGTETVGLYQAGYTLINKYTALVLTALGMEYYPRLSRIAGDRKRLSESVSQEIIVSMVVITAIASIFIVLRYPIISLLYSGEFHAVAPMIAWGAVGTVLRTLSWCLAFVILAKGAGRIYIITETISAVLFLVLSMACYVHSGITGLGVAYLLWYAFYTLIVAWVYVGTFRLKLTGATVAVAATALATTAAVAVAVLLGHTALAFAITAVAVLVSVTATIRLARRR